jgi:hypothetical protein
MAGRTLFEVATGVAPKAGGYNDMQRLAKAPVTPKVGAVIAALANENHRTCLAALETLLAARRR